MNRTVSPEAQVADRVASLMGTTLTEADVHRFLLDAADILGTESFAVYGPDLFFRWPLGDRFIEIISKSWNGEYFLIVNSFNRERAINIEEGREFEYGEFYEFPYVWAAELGSTPFHNSIYGVCILNWDMFDETLAGALESLPGNLDLIPPQWRRPLTFRWDMSASGLGTVAFTGTTDGITVTVEATREQVLIPRELLGNEVKMGDVVAGLAGGLPLGAIRSADPDGIDWVWTSILHGDERNPFDTNADEEREEGPARPAMTMDDLRRLVAVASIDGNAADTESEPSGAVPDVEILPMRIGFTISQVLGIVDQVLKGTDAEEILKRLGGQPGSRWDKPVLRGDGWLAKHLYGGGGWAIEVVTIPEGERQCFDQRHVADYAWRIAQALEQRYGSPYGMHTDNDGNLSRLFQVGDHGVTVRGWFSTVTVEIGSFDSLAMLGR